MQKIRECCYIEGSLLFFKSKKSFENRNEKFCLFTVNIISFAQDSKYKEIKF
jgi:hypothetical protein